MPCFLKSGALALIFGGMNARKKTLLDSQISFEDSSSNQLPCAEKGCLNPGVHKAPKNREHVREYIYLCAEHIAAYNARWNYYAGMSAAQVAQENDKDLTWRRPRHLFGTRQKDFSKVYGANPFEAFTGKSADVPESAGLSEEVRTAVSFFELDYPYSLMGLKKKYRLFAKKYHPDTASDQASVEELFSKTLKCYQVLLRHLKK